MALNHEQPDRCPLQISFTPEFASRLRLHLREEGGTQHNPHGGGNTYELERALYEDLLLTSVGWAFGSYIVTPRGNPMLLFAGVAMVFIAVVVNSLAYRTAAASRQEVSASGLWVCLFSGILFSGFGPLLAKAIC
jgi:hypothetical protein